MSKLLSIKNLRVRFRTNSPFQAMINKIEDAKIEDGGSGAFYIFLKKKVTK